MKNKKIIVLVLAITLLFFVFLSFTAFLVSANNTDVYTYLVAGLDDANENTDVLMLISLNISRNTVSILQIPRDTYYSCGYGNNKINGLYSHFKSEGKGSEGALKELTECVEKVFDVKIDGSAAITTEAFRTFIDSIGGVTLSLKNDYIYEDEHGKEKLYLKSGDNLLSGKDAEIFVRYRKGYLMGDISRMNAQKIFLSALYNRLCKIDASNLMKALNSVQHKMITDLKIRDFLKISMKHRGRNKKPDVKFATLPGEAIMYNGVSYYVVNRDSSSELLSSYFFADDIDPQKRLVLSGESAFENIYYDTDFGYTEYSNDSIGDVTIR